MRCKCRACRLQKGKRGEEGDDGERCLSRAVFPHLLPSLLWSFPGVVDVVVAAVRGNSKRACRFTQPPSTPAYNNIDSISINNMLLFAMKKRSPLSPSHIYYTVYSIRSGKTLTSRPGCRASTIERSLGTSLHSSEMIGDVGIFSME